MRRGLGRRWARHDRPVRTGRRDKPIIHLPSVALRVMILTGVAVLLFGIIFFRLWYLQILSGERFVAQANDNRLRSVKVVAPRGPIVDRNGKVIVENRAGLAVGIRLMDVPEGNNLLYLPLESLQSARRMAPRAISPEGPDSPSASAPATVGAAAQRLRDLVRERDSRRREVR